MESFSLFVGLRGNFSFRVDGRKMGWTQMSVFRTFYVTPLNKDCVFLSKMVRSARNLTNLIGRKGWHGGQKTDMDFRKN